LKVEQPQKRIPPNTAMTADTGFISMGWKSAPQIEPVKFSDEERTWRSNASVACAFERDSRVSAKKSSKSPDALVALPGAVRSAGWQ
jgi:hypothetical protein